MSRHNPDPERVMAKPTRGEIETLCMLFAVGDGCTTGELTARLGLSPTIADAVGSAATTLVEGGLLRVDGESFRITDAGRAALVRFRGTET